MAKAMDVNPLLFVSPAPESAEDILQFWLDEDNRIIVESAKQRKDGENNAIFTN